MAERKHSYIQLLSLLGLFYVSHAVKVENIMIQSNFYQTQNPTGEFIREFNKDELYYVDLDKKEAIWGLPQFGNYIQGAVDGALQNIATMKYNLDICIQRSNHSAANNDPPEIHIYTEKPLVLGEPNILICVTTKFFPPVIKMNWLKNGQPVMEGVTETVFYPIPDGSFSKFIYLAFIPTKDDMYTCSVEHAGLPVTPTNKLWVPEIPPHNSETTENMICGLGLALGIIGIIAGMVLTIKGIKNNRNQGSGH